jgi:hypothetical protein
VVNNRISTHDFTKLNSTFTSQEVLVAIKNLKANSAPGTDGLSALFYQTYWEVIGPNIIDFVLNILNNEGSVQNINHTFISLIPKNNSPNTPSDLDLLAFAMLF